MDQSPSSPFTRTGCRGITERTLSLSLVDSRLSSFDEPSRRLSVFDYVSIFVESKAEANERSSASRRISIRRN